MAKTNKKTRDNKEIKLPSSSISETELRRPLNNKIKLIQPVTKRLLPNFTSNIMRI